MLNLFFLICTIRSSYLLFRRLLSWYRTDKKSIFLNVVQLFLLKDSMCHKQAHSKLLGHHHEVQHLLDPAGLEQHCHRQWSADDLSQSRTSCSPDRQQGLVSKKLPTATAEKAVTDPITLLFFPTVLNKPTQNNYSIIPLI